MRKAVLEDLPIIMAMVKKTIEEMHGNNNWQWDEKYPQEHDFVWDIQNRELFVAERNECLAGFICINQVEPLEYKGVTWSCNESAYVIHRMVVGTDYRCRGVGEEMVGYAAELAIHNGISCVKTDTYSINRKAQKLFEKCGYRRVGKMNFRGKEKPFYCYEKSIE